MPSVDEGWWLTLERESSSCPACESPGIILLDVLPIPKSPDGNRVVFVTGCRACGLLFTNPLPRHEELVQYYQPDGRWASVRAERIRRLEAIEARRQRSRRARQKSRLRPRSRALFDALAAHLSVYDPPPGAKLLDFGCGDGKFLNKFQDLGWDTYGVEPSTDAAFVRHHRLHVAPQDGSFDFVFLNHVLEHVGAPLAVLEQLAATLRIGGVLFVSVPRVDTLPVHGDLDYCISGRKHVMCFSETCLRGLLARAGFTTAARLDTHELDAIFTDGKPLRLRLVAVRTSSPDPLPVAPLAPALEALSQYVRISESVGARVRRLLPVRMRGGLLERAAERRVLERRQARAEGSLDRGTGGT
ncbi:MAG: class I SAM-dependent methyltransferase [Acidobacteria bacterium]|nr:class I SAM-dependent methyltransferase [Acidobacteriota bacterium]